MYKYTPQTKFFYKVGEVYAQKYATTLMKCL